MLGSALGAVYRMGRGHILGREDRWDQDCRELKPLWLGREGVGWGHNDFLSHLLPMSFLYVTHI